MNLVVKTLKHRIVGNPENGGYQSHSFRLEGVKTGVCTIMKYLELCFDTKLSQCSYMNFSVARNFKHTISKS